MSVLPTISGLLVVLAALGYAVATIFMKMASGSNSYILLAIIAVCLSSAVMLEIIVLRRMNLGVAYIAILGTETLLIMGYAFFIGEGLAPREMVGAVLVFSGTLCLAA